MSKFDWEATEVRFNAAMRRMDSIIEEYASFQRTLEEEENFLAKRRARLRHTRAHFASIAQDVAATRRDLEALRKQTNEEEIKAVEFERRLSQRFGPLRGSW